MQAEVSHNGAAVNDVSSSFPLASKTSASLRKQASCWDFAAELCARVRVEKFASLMYLLEQIRFGAK